MELWASGFNAWNNLDFNDKQQQTQLPSDIPLFRCILKDDCIEVLRTTVESTLVKISTGVRLAGRPTAITKLHTENPDEFANVVIAGNNRVLEVIDGTLTEYNNPSDCVEDKGIRHASIKNISQIAAGQTFFTALSTTGDVYTWGDPRYASTLGRDITLDHPAQTPSQVTEFSSLPTGTVRHISTGGYVSAALTTDNDLYLWGGRAGETPLLPELTSEPTPFDLDGEDVLDVDVGMDHIIALSMSHRLYVVGSNSNGQLGLDVARTNGWTEVVLPLREDQVVVGVLAGYKNSFLLLDTKT